MSADLLTTVVAAAARSADARAARLPLDILERALESAPRTGDAFVASLRVPGVRVIAECKRRSPSRGVLRPVYAPADIAAGYAAAGAAAISVLTEPTFFDGSLEHLRAVRARVDIPVLRKDFIVDEYQIAEAAVAGASAVLLIAAALDDRAIERLLGASARLGVAALVEVHDAEELRRALGAGARVIGVNSRNLRSLEVDLAVFDALAPALPAGVIAIAESGLRTAEDLARLRALRFDAFLIGERFMTSPDPGAALAALIADAERLAT
jgi:indole-3-glycerol phosphate synthase